MAALGAAAEVVAEAEARAAPLPVAPGAWDAVRLFLAAETQWRRAGMGGRPTGLDYPAVAMVAGVLGLTLDAALLGQVKVIEVEALTAMLEAG
jgi:hypothetical protein